MFLYFPVPMSLRELTLEIASTPTFTWPFASPLFLTKAGTKFPLAFISSQETISYGMLAMALRPLEHCKSL